MRARDAVFDTWRWWEVHAFTAAAVVFLLAAEPGAANAAHDAVRGTARARFLMGTRLSIETDGVAPPGALDAAFDEVARLEGILSNWKDTSEISLLNRTAARAPVRCSKELFEAVRAALGWAEGTDGAFDPTVEPLVRALGLRGEDGRLPGTPGLSGLRAIGATSERPAGDESTAGDGDMTARLTIGWRHVHLDRRSRSIRYDAPGVGLDLGGIGKGIALDAAARVLRSHGVRRALLDFGGQVLALGRPEDSRGWGIGIADPEDRERAVAVVEIDGLSVATSGNSERSVLTPRGSLGHLLDPAARRPARFGGSLTVAAQDATSADALSTALFVMGPDRGSAWAEPRQVAAVYLWRDASGQLRRKATRAFEDLIGARSGGSKHRPRSDRPDPSAVRLGRSE